MDPILVERYRRSGDIDLVSVERYRRGLNLTQYQLKDIEGDKIDPIPLERYRRG